MKEYKNSEIICIDECYDYLLEWEQDSGSINGMWYQGRLTAVVLYSDGEWLYQSNMSSDPTRNKEESRVMFEFLFIWRGVWETRVGFRDTEYWGNEIKVMNTAWDQISAIMKQVFREDHPGYKFDD